MRQNAPNPFSISIFSGGGALPPDSWGGEGKGREREEEGEGNGKEGKGRGSLRHCRWGIDASVVRKQMDICSGHFVK